MVSEEEVFEKKYEEKKKEIVESINKIKSQILSDSSDIETEILTKLKGQ